MNNLLEASIDEVFSNHFSMPTQPCQKLPQGIGYVASIPFSDINGAQRALLWLQKPVIEKISDLLLGEDSPDEATLADLTAEVANFVVGHAKMEASDQNNSFSMGTPSFEGIRPLEGASENIRLFSIDDGCIALQIESVDAR
ncbi:chemotaxis protein CheX [Hydrogenimonas sp.]